jgi:hypothetical protein
MILELIAIWCFTECPAEECNEVAAKQGGQQTNLAGLAHKSEEWSCKEVLVCAYWQDVSLLQESWRCSEFLQDNML